LFFWTHCIPELHYVLSTYYMFLFDAYYRFDIMKYGEYSEASLSGVEPLMQKIHSEIRRVDAGILAAVRQQVMIFAYSFDVFISILNSF